MRIGSMLLVCALLLAGCGCVDPTPDSPSTCNGIGSVFEGSTPGGAAGDLVTVSSNKWRVPRQ
jgi:hypothetical protein